MFPPLMIIKPRDKDIKNLLDSGFYTIPRFQRPYSWDKSNVEDFWSDAIAASEEDYFIGSFVVYGTKKQQDLFYLVDGQQRLTTITILFAVIRNGLDGLGFKDLAQGVQNLIERNDINNEKHHVLQTQTSYPFFQEHIQKYGSPALDGDDGDEEDALRDAFNDLTEYVDSALAAIDKDKSIDQGVKTEAKKKRLLEFRDALLRLKLIVVELDNEDDAYLVFETLNTRGKDLGVADLVKNHLTRLLRPTNKGVDSATQKWNDIRERFDESASDIRINSFLHHVWLSRYGYTSENKLFREVKRTVVKAKAQGFLDELVDDSKLYRIIFEPTSHKWKNDEAPILDALQLLNVFRVRQPVPLLISGLRSYFAKELSLKQLLHLFGALERFHVVFTAVTSQRTGGGTARMYALSARELVAAKDKNARGVVIKDFVAKLKERVPSLAQFQANFKDILFLDQQTKHKPLLQYLLRRIDEHYRKGVAVHYRQMTIEHLAPQSAASTAGVDARTTGCLGNLILVSSDMNSKLGNKSFAQKKALLEKAKAPLDPTLEQATVWTSKEIKERNAALIKLLYETILVV